MCKFWRETLLLALLLLAAQAGQSQDQDGTGAWDGTLRRIHVPILMYHYVGSVPIDADAIRVNLTVTREQFRAQMTYLHSNGYHTISLYQLHAALTEGAALPANPVVLTFDDGYRDHYVDVFPVLREYGFTGTFFIITGRIDAQSSGYLTWAQITEMAAAGMDMEPHSVSHAELDERDYDFLVYEMLGSQQTLETNLGRPVRMFAYPAGRYDAMTLYTIATTALWRAVTTEPGTQQTTDNRFLMPRVRISNDTEITSFAALLQR